MKLHSLPPERSNLHARFAASAVPVLTVDSGDVVSFQVPDVSWGLEPPTSTTAPRRKVEPRDTARDDGPCLCGPVYVRGASPGDTLEIGIEHVRPGAWGWTYSGRGMSTPSHNSAMGIGAAPLTLLRWAIDHERGIAINQFGHVVSTKPFLGTIGLAPQEENVSGWLPRACGGNMDCRELIDGSTLYLPVMVEGGLLSVGDGHAAQGDGELSGTAIECPIEEARLRLTVRRDMRITGPRAKVPEGWITMGFGETLDAAANVAASAMLDLMVEHLHIPRPEALALASARVQLRITQMVNPLRGVHAILSP